MRINDARRLDRETQEYIRKRAVALSLQGEPVAQIARNFDVNRTTIYEWINLYREGGWDALNIELAPGGSCKLSDEQQQQLIEMILGHDPRDYDMESALWTQKIISELILRTFGISLGVTAVGEMLQRWDVVPLKPLRRAYDRDPAAIQEWLDTTYPDIKLRATEHGADIVYLDEMGIRSDSPLGRTWGEKGGRTVVKTPGDRQSINAISAVSYDGAFWFDVYAGNLNAQRFEDELRNLMRFRRRPLFVILDKHRAHIAQRVDEYVKSLGGMLELHFLPSYAPDLNPDEYVWNYVKSHGPSKFPLAKGEGLPERIVTILEYVKSMPDMVRNIVQPIVNAIELSGFPPIM